MKPTEDLSQTHHSLFAPLQRGDNVAWARFHEKYVPLLRKCLASYRLSDADREDLVLAIIARIYERMTRFVYNPAGRFRGWLATLAYHEVCDFFKRQRSRGGVGTPLPPGEEIQDPGPSPEEVVEEEEELAREQELFRLAVEHTKARVAPARWSAFELMVIQEMSGRAVAEQLGRPIHSVYKDRSEVARMLREAVSELAPSYSPR